MNRASHDPTQPAVVQEQSHASGGDDGAAAAAAAGDRSGLGIKFLKRASKGI